MTRADKLEYQIRGVAVSSNQLVDDSGDTFEFPTPDDVKMETRCKGVPLLHHDHA